MNKKVTSIVLALVMAVSFACCSKKEATQETQAPLENVYNFSTGGVAIDEYENEENLHGSLGTSMGYELEQGTGVYLSALTYFAISPSDLEAMMELPEEEFTEDMMQNLRDRRGYISAVYAIDGNRSIDDVADYLSELGLDISGNEFLGTVGEYNFYYQMNPTHIDYANDTIFEDEFVEDVNTLMEHYSDASHYHIFVPEAVESASEGTHISFQTVDLEGNTVDSAELFAQNTVTMINIWGTSCGPCIDEMPMLNELNNTMNAQGGAIVGIIANLSDLNDEDTREAAEDIVASTGVEFQQLLKWETMDTDLPNTFTPTSYFVNSEGYIIGEVVIGTRTEAEYTEMFNQALAAVS